LLFVFSPQKPNAKIVLTTVTDDDTSVETPWAFRLGTDLYRLDNIPFFAYGISLGDVVEAAPQADDPRPHFRRIVQKSGNRTVRVVAEEGAESVAQQILDGLEGLGCCYTGANPRYICLNIPPDVSLDRVVEYLTATGLRWEHADPTYGQLHGER
jgi:hypothetical protein